MTQALRVIKRASNKKNNEKLASQYRYIKMLRCALVNLKWSCIYHIYLWRNPRVARRTTDGNFAGTALRFARVVRILALELQRSKYWGRASDLTPQRGVRPSKLLFAARRVVETNFEQHFVGTWTKAKAFGIAQSIFWSLSTTVLSGKVPFETDFCTDYRVWRWILFVLINCVLHWLFFVAAIKSGAFII